MRLNGQLYAFNRTPDEDEDGDYHEFDWRGPAFGTDPLVVPVTDAGDHGITAQTGNPPAGNNVPVNIEAMAFQGIGVGSVLWGVGIVDPAEPDFNYLWRFNQVDGDALDNNNGATVPSDPAPVGVVDPGNPPMTEPFVEAMDTGAGGGPGGIITGMAIVNGTMYFVSENGGFYSRQGNTFDFVTLVNDAAGNPISFSGLTLAPQRVESGDYADLMFATDVDGNLYALDEMGVLQAIFSDSATSVQIPGLADVRGLAFSTLDYNLWHVTSLRQGDAGHGLDPTPDRVRTRRVNGGQSFYFGIERDGGQPGAGAYDPNFVNGFGPDYRTYDLPGGAARLADDEHVQPGGLQLRRQPDVVLQLLHQPRHDRR